MKDDKQVLRTLKCFKYFLFNFINYEINILRRVRKIAKSDH